MTDADTIAKLEAIVADPEQAELHGRAKAGLAKLRTHAPRAMPPEEREREAIGMALARAREQKGPEAPSGAETAAERFAQGVTAGGLRPIVALGAAIRESREGEPGKQITSLFDKFMEMSEERAQAGRKESPVAAGLGTVSGAVAGGPGLAGERLGAAIASRAIPAAGFLGRMGRAAVTGATTGAVAGGVERGTEAAISTKPKSTIMEALRGMGEGAKAGLALSPAAASLGAASARIRDPRTPRGRNLEVMREAGVTPTTLGGGRAEEIGKMRFPTGGLEGRLEPARMGAAGAEQVGVQSAERVHKWATNRYQAINTSFGKAEADVMARSPNVTVPSTPVVEEFLEAAATKEFRGMPLDADDVKFFEQAAERVAQGPLSLRDAVKLRRALDDRAHMNRMATKDDVPFRQASEMLRGQIGDASPELRKMYAQHHENLSQLEDVNEHLFGKSVAATEEAPNLIDRAAKRLARLKEEGGSRKIEQEILRLSREIPELRGTMTDPAIKMAVEQMRIGRWSPAYTGTGMIARNVGAFGDPLLGRVVDPLARGGESAVVRAAPDVSTLYSEITEAAKKKSERKMRLLPTGKGARP